MIGTLRGLVASVGDSHAIIDVGGVGYRVYMPANALAQLPPGEEVHVVVHTHVREDIIQLFGFFSDTDRELFLTLTKITGVGPKVALSILGTSSLDELAEAVVLEDAKRLTHIKGVGKKTAARILVELKGALERLPVSAPASLGAPAGAPSRSSHLQDVASALANLGFKPAQIERTLTELKTRDPAPPDDFNALMREALKVIR